VSYICFAPDQKIISRTFKIRGALVFLCPKEKREERQEMRDERKEKREERREKRDERREMRDE
jgi:uncharacterized membrane protein